MAIDPGAEPYYADEMGFFTKAGLKATVQSLPNANAMVAALVAGDIDIGFLGVNILEQAHAKGIPLIAVAPAAVVDPSRHVVFMMVRNGVSIASAKDFEGKTVGSSPLRSIGELAMDTWVDKNGGDSSKIKYLDLPYPAVPAAFEQGRIDAAIIVEPFATLSKPNAHAFGPDPMTAIAPSWLGNTYVCTKAWAAAHPDQIARFAAALRETAGWANKNPDQTATILAKYSKASVASIQSGARALFSDQKLTPAMFQPTIDVLVRYKEIDGLKADELVYQSPR
jgi:NitT/TauT family transport system substrate-binding protein